MFKFIIKFLRSLVASDLVEELASVRGELTHTKKTLIDIREELSLKESDIKVLIDRYLYASGAPMLYTNDPPKPAQGPRDPFSGVSQARDYSRIASMVESQAFAEDMEFKQNSQNAAY